MLKKEIDVPTIKIIIHENSSLRFSDTNILVEVSSNTTEVILTLRAIFFCAIYGYAYRVHFFATSQSSFIRLVPATLPYISGHIILLIHFNNLTYIWILNMYVPPSYVYCIRVTFLYMIYVWICIVRQLSTFCARNVNL